MAYTNFRELGASTRQLADIGRGMVGAYRLRRTLRKPESKRTLKYLGAGVLVGTVTALGFLLAYRHRNSH